MTDSSAGENGIRWGHFGGCVNQFLFREATLPLFEAACGARPIQVYELYQRNMASIVADWGFLAEHPELLAEATPEEALFLNNWLPLAETFNSLDILFANIVSDLLYQFTTISLRHEGVGRRVAGMGELIFNHPLEPSERLSAQLELRQTTEAENLAAWVEFGRRVQTPVVMFLYATRNQHKPVCAEEYYQQLNRCQTALRDSLGHLPNWHFIEVDELLECRPEYYLNRHHLTGAGYARFRESLLRVLSENGLFASLRGGPPLARTAHGIPDRCDIKHLLPGYWAKLARVYSQVTLVGPERLTTPAASELSAHGLSLETYRQLGQIPKARPPQALVLLRWSQSQKEPGWLAKLRQQFPDTLFELPSEWKLALLLSSEENALRSELRAQSKSITWTQLPESALARRYLARILADSHRLESNRLVPLAAGGIDSESIAPKPLGPAWTAALLRPERILTF